MAVQKKNIIIVGAGGFGREIASLMLDATQPDQDWVIKGFLDDTLATIASTVLGFPVLSTVDSYSVGDNDYFLVAIGSPQDRQTMVKKIEKKGGYFFTFIHPKAMVLTTAIIGRGCIIYPYVVISTGAVLGNFVSVNFFTAVGHDSSIGAYSFICAHCDITGGVRIGERVVLGNGANTIPGIKIGDDAILAAGSTAFRNIGNGKTFIGCPAKLLS